ncbi:MAG: hypothetical protein AB4063_01310 [Crocosphaera sp.]
MTQSNSQQPTNQNNQSENGNSNEFTTLATAITTLGKGRSDGVAIFGMFSLVLAFMTFIIGGVYIHSNATQPNNNQPVQQESISEEKQGD